VIAIAKRNAGKLYLTSAERDEKFGGRWLAVTSRAGGTSAARAVARPSYSPADSFSTRTVRNASIWPHKAGRVPV